MRIKPTMSVKQCIPLMVLLISNAIAHSLFMISFPVAGRELGLSDLQTGALLSLSAFTMMLASPWWGKRIDRQGHRSAIFNGILITGLFLIAASLLFIFQSTLLWPTTVLFAVLLTFRIIQSLGVAGLMPSAQAYIAMATADEKRVSGMGMLGATFGFGSLIGGSLAMAGGTAFFPVTMLVLGGLMILLCLRFPLHQRLFGHLHHESSKDHDGEHPKQRPHLNIKRILPYLVITFCVLLSYGLLQQTVAIRLQDQLGFTAQEALKGGGALLTVAMICMAAGQAVLCWLTISRPNRWLILGLIGSILGFAALAISDSFPTMLASMAGIGLMMSLIFPSNLALISLSADQDNQAYAASLNTISKGLGLAAGPLLGATLYQIHPTLPVWAALFLLVMSLAVMLSSSNAFRSLRLMTSR